MVTVDKSVASLIERNASISDFKTQAMNRKGTIMYRASRLVAQGRTTLDMAKQLGELEALS